MSEDKALALAREVLAAYKQKKKSNVLPTLICAAAWVVSLMIVGKSALLLAIPATLIALVREADK